MRQLLVDSNLLILFIVGSTDKSMISQHKRTRQYTEKNFDLLLELISPFQNIVVTPNIMTETSNLLRQGVPGHQELFNMVFRNISEALIEETISSREALQDGSLYKLGITDSVIEILSRRGIQVITSDLDLYLALSRNNVAVKNFNHYIDNYR